MDTRKQRILIVDDHPLYLDGVNALLQEMFEEADIFQACCGNEAITIAEDKSDINWVFLDYFLPDTDGLALLQKIHNQLQSASIVVVSGCEKLALISEAFSLGAKGFIAKSGVHSEYLRCIEKIRSGTTYLAPDLELRLQHYRKTVEAEQTRVKSQISKRQTEVLLLISAGYNNTEIAKSLGISRHTVKDHVSSIMQILNADNRVHCIAEARQLGLIH